MPSYRTSAFALLALSALLAGCASKEPATTQAQASQTGVQVSNSGSRLFGFLRPYRIDIQQGNFVSKEMVSQLRPGMTQEQVRFVLGTPLLTDLFHSDRWDYEFRLTKGNGDLITSRVTVFFKDKLLDHYEGGGNLPTEQEYLSLIAGSKEGAKAQWTSSSTTETAPTATPTSDSAPAK